MPKIMSFQMSLGLALTALERLDAGNLKDRYAIHRISGQVLPTRETRSCDLSGGHKLGGSTSAVLRDLEVYV
jgi:hypothetical protein